MNPAQLLEHFDRISEAPDAVARLRRFILDLAVRGKLIKPTGQTKLVPLAALCASTSGNGKMIKGTLSAESGEGLYPCFSASGQDVWHNKFEHVGEAVIVSAVGARCGKAFLASGKWSAIANTHILFPKNETCSLAYLYLIANNEALWIRGGSAQPFVKVSATLKERLVYSPSVAEQHLIVTKVDELMALCDQLEAAKKERELQRDRLVAATLHRIGTAPANADQAATEARSATPLRDAARFHLDHLPRLTTRPEHIKQLRQTILNLAVRGRLVSQDPNDEPAIVLLERIANEKALLTKKRKTQNLETAVSPGDVNSYVLPAGWAWSNAQDVCQLDQIITYGILKPVWVEFGVPTVRVTEMKTGTIDVASLPRCDSARAAKFGKTTLAVGDLLISKDGTIGKTAFVPAGLEGGNITQHVLRFPINNALNRHFVRICIDAPVTQKWLNGETKGVALQGVNVGDFRRMPIPVPPLAEQHRIVAKVDELMALCDQLEAQLTATQTDSRRLLEAVLYEALAAAA